MKLREKARPFIVCQVGDGNLAMFWHDNWTGLGPLINITGPMGPQVTGITALAPLKEVVENGSWILPRGRHPLLVHIRACLPAVPPILTSSQSDLFLWRTSPNSPPSVFSSSKTWDALHPSPSTVSWYKAVWFSSNIPKHSFLVWVLAWDRLPTRDKLRYWGIEVSPNCLLCDTLHETKEHLFFSCAYSQELWRLAFSGSGFNPPMLFDDVLEWLRANPSNKRIRLICKLLFQAVVYVIWRERNTRLHNSTSRSIPTLLKEVHLLIRAKLFGLDRNASPPQLRSASVSPSTTYLQLWFGRFQV
ncbi:unnamed protein product [Brassica rapa subsp. narinosa]